MRLPDYSGPFQVGCIDLEIPVRNPRSFATDIIPPDVINKPRKQKRTERKGVKNASSSEGTSSNPKGPKGSQKEDDPTPLGNRTTASAQRNKLSPGRPFRNWNWKPKGVVPSKRWANKSSYTPEQHRRKEEVLLAKQQEQADHGVMRKISGKRKGRESASSVQGVKGQNEEQRKSEEQRRVASGASSQKVNGKAKNTSKDEKNVEEAEFEDLSNWSPFDMGSKTSTLRFETVLFTLYYPSSCQKPATNASTTASTSSAQSQTSQDKTHRTKARYSHVAWAGRPKRASLLALAGYVGQYGPFALPITPAIFSLLNATLPAIVAPPLADPWDERLTKAAVLPKFEGRSEGGKKGTGTGFRASFFGSFGSNRKDVQEAVAENQTSASPNSASQDSKTVAEAETEAETIDNVWSGNHDRKRWPVVFFSHGLAGSRLSYSQYCGELASHGVVVVALEHRDGSGLQTSVRASSLFASQHFLKRSSSTKVSGSTRANGQNDVQGARPGYKVYSNGHVKTQDTNGGWEDVSVEEKESHADIILQYRKIKHGARYGRGFGNGMFRASHRRKIKVVPRREGPPGSSSTVIGKTKLTVKSLAPRKAIVPYLTFEKYKLRSFSTQPTEEESGLRQAQIAMRIAEIEEAKHVLHRLNNGEGYQLYLESTRSLGSKLADRRHWIAPPDSIVRDPKRQFERFEGKLDMDFPLVVGHSFGGCTVAQLQRSVRPPFPAAILLDPWVEPLSMEGQEPITAPLFVVNSETFTVWKECFTKLKQLCHEAREANEEHRGWLMTLCGSAHLDFSDLPLILPHIFRSVVGPKATIAIFFQATFTQMGLLRRRHRERLANGTASPRNGPQDKARLQLDLNGLKPGDFALTSESSRDSEEGLNMRLSPALMTPAKEYPGIGFASESISSPPSSADGHASQSKSPKLGKVNRISSRRSAATQEDGQAQMGPVSEIPELDLTQQDGKPAAPKLDEEEKANADDEPQSSQNATPAEGDGGKAKRPRLGGVVAYRTPSGNLVGQRRPTNASVDFIDDPELFYTIAGDADSEAAEVLRHTQALSDKLSYKDGTKIHSILGAMLHVQGIRPGLSTPGRMLCHQY